ncbi:HDOD domain-containing protein [Caldimonas tepidiphila]|uniref:HDOD domain-containing protein n=1 Tax=Caldimonas tepidiphila TaxID=2315841 RepID=UPI001474E56E|nr:serine/threonine protein kinase [Caldimonas tepidiphila]
MSAPPETPTPAAVAGRFQLRRRLGQSAGGGGWWLAFDASSAREVALCQQARRAWPDATPAAWAAAAAPVLALRHPNIVPLLEIDTAPGQWLRIAEFVPGVPLDSWVAEHGAMPARQAVQTALGVLDALAHSHEAGVVHGRLRPSRLLLDAAARPLLCDYTLGPIAGVADARSRSGALYLAPEQARGLECGPPADLFCLALVLGELLTGRPVLHESVPGQALARLTSGPLEWPEAEDSEAVDAALLQIVRRALAPDPAARPDAATLRADLLDWLTPALLDGALDDRAGGTLRALMQRLQFQPDLPAQREALRRVRQLCSVERVNLDELTQAVLEDMALTLKLLKMGNAASFRSVGGSVTQVSRASALLGVVAVRNLAGSLATLEDLPDPAHAAALREEYGRARMGARIAAQLSPTRGEEEEAAITALLQQLGRILVHHFLPEAAAQVRELLRERRITEPEATLRVLGLSFEDITVSVARSWGMPDAFLHGLRRPVFGAALRAPERRGDWLRLLASFGNELSETHRGAEPHERQLLLRSSIERYSAALRVSSAQAWSALQAHGSVAEVSDVPAPLPSAEAAPAPAPVHPLSRALIELQAMRKRQHTGDEAMKLAGEAVVRSIGCRHVVIAMREAGGKRLLARFSFGADAASIHSHFQIALDGNDVFATLCARGADTLIADAGVTSIASRLPDWHRRHFACPAFLLLPLMRPGEMPPHPIGLLYVDAAEPGGLRFSDRELSLLRSLRDELLRSVLDATDAAGT